VRVRGPIDRARVQVGDGAEVPASVMLRGDDALVTVDGVTRTVRTAGAWIARGAATFAVTEPDSDHATEGEASSSPQLVSPMPGTVVLVPATDGAHVSPGDPVVVVEAMKMEHVLRSTVAGTVRIGVAVGDQVARGGVVAVVEPAHDDRHEEDR
jgi:acetyl-CoA/propionyl-CoA carboxylase biotin carboxyl carrier protein